MIVKSTVNDKNMIIEILNEVALNLIKKGINQWGYPINEEEIDFHKCYLLLESNETIGVFFLKELKDFYLYKIAIKPKFQSRGYGKIIIDFTKSMSIDKNKYFFLDCWAGNEKLKNFYKNCQLTYMGDFPEEDYFVSIFKG